MKKKIFSGVFALALLLIAGYGVNRSMNSYADLSDLALRNVLALAQIENPDPGEDGGNVVKAKRKVNYTSLEIIHIGEIPFECLTFGVSCDGSGPLDCVQWSITNCNKL